MDDPIKKTFPHKILRQPSQKCGDDLGIVYELDDGQLSDEQYAKIKELTNDILPKQNI